MYFGAAFYHYRELVETPTLVSRLLELLRDAAAEGDVTFQGLLRGGESYTRLKRLSGRAEGQLHTDLLGGVFSSVLGFVGAREQPIATITIELDRPSRPLNKDTGLALYFVMRANSVEPAVEAALQFWNLLEPEYGFSEWGESFTSVYAEVTATPISDWRSPVDAERELRLLRLQRNRPLMGLLTRGGTWGSYLGGRLAKKMGGDRTIRESAPVDTIAKLQGGGLYLQLAGAPLLLASPEYQAAAQQLEDYLRPVLPVAQ